MIRGDLGKSFVIKHYEFGTFMTRYPDMTKIVASKQQRICRNLFKEAVAWAKTVIADPTRKKEWQKRLKKSKRVYHAAIKHYMIHEKANLQPAGQTGLLKRESIKQQLHPYYPSYLERRLKCCKQALPLHWMSKK